jgi:hypothetical protein
MRNRKRKRKRKNSAPRVGGGFRPKPLSPLSRARSSPLPLAAQATQFCAPTPDSPAPPVSCSSPLPLASPSLWQPGPARQIPRPTHAFTGAFAADHRPPHLLAINARTSSVGAMRPRSLCPSHPLTPPPARAVPSPFAPSPPSWQAHRCLPSLLPSPSPGRL